MTPLLRIPPCDPTLMVSDPFYAADHALEWEWALWEIQSEQVSHINRYQEVTHERAS